MALIFVFSVEDAKLRQWVNSNPHPPDWLSVPKKSNNFNWSESWLSVMLNTEVLKKNSLIIALICHLIELSLVRMDSYRNSTSYANEPKLSALKIPCSGQEQEQLVNTAPPQLPELRVHKISRWPAAKIEMPSELPFCGCFVIIRWIVQIRLDIR